jgi:poly-gamma-glutamate synthesis protein (capsule biosynthesis protein)
LPLFYSDPGDYHRRFGSNLEHEHWRTSLPIDLKGVAPDAIDDYPFSRVTGLLRGADIAFINLEAPLSDRAEQIGGFLMPTTFAGALARARIDVVSTANNHMLDAETTGLHDTLDALAAAGIGAAGSGRDLAEARRPLILERKGQRLAFLAYSQSSNVETGFALPERAGVAPLDPELIDTDVRTLASDGHTVIVSLHWGIENTSDVHTKEREIARRIIDAGARLVLGHGPHVPRGVESYRGGMIIYSLGNLVFGHGHDKWTDNYLALATFEDGRVAALELRPVSGTGTSVSQPHPLDGERAMALLKSLRQQSAGWGTNLQITGSAGLLWPNAR